MSFALIDEPEGIQYGSAGRVSPYRAALEQLQDAGEGKVLCFETTKCRGSVSTAARKLDMAVIFAEKDGKLYVKYTGPLLPKTRTPRPPRSSEEDSLSGKVRAHLKAKGPASAQEIATATGLTSQQVHTTCFALRTQNEIFKRDSDGKWEYRHA